jgi:hypothetical protein
MATDPAPGVVADSVPPAVTAAYLAVTIPVPVPASTTSADVSLPPSTTLPAPAPTPATASAGDAPSPPDTPQQPKVLCDLGGHCVRIETSKDDTWRYLGATTDGVKVYMDLTTSYRIGDPSSGEIDTNATLKYKGKQTGTLVISVDCHSGSIIFSSNPTIPVTLSNSTKMGFFVVVYNIFHVLCKTSR